MKYLIVFAGISFLVACGAGTGETSKSDSPNATQDIINAGGTEIDTAQNISGSQLIAANDCLTCHKIGEKSFGPSYKQIADKYEMNQGNIENLASRIIKGGKGLWGQNAMTPHANLPEPQAEKMVQYILSLRDSSATK
ncbi:MAG: c-type cytochrome [Parafilimonas sp.]